MIQKILNSFGYYKPEQVFEHFQIGGHCGCCGKGIPDGIYEKDWAWGLCDNCIKTS